jgi:uncharacterized protein YqgC (DUF456 family)
VSDLGLVVVGLAIAVGIVGVVVPVLPGSLLAWGAIVVWALAVGSATAWAALAIATLLIGSAQVVKFLVPGRRLRDAGVPRQSILAGLLVAAVGFFVIPVVGFFIGFPVGVYLEELRRLGRHADAWGSTRQALRAMGSRSPSNWPPTCSPPARGLQRWSSVDGARRRRAEWCGEAGSPLTAVERLAGQRDGAAALGAVRSRLGLVALLFGLAAVAWWSTADRMAGMDGGPGTDLGTLGWFLGVWVVMMAAMMLPSVAPTVALYARVIRRSSPAAPLLFAAGYLASWAAAGLVAYGAGARRRGARRPARVGRRRTMGGGRHADRRRGLRADGGQGVCLSRCRNPLGSWRQGPSGRRSGGRPPWRVVRGLLLGAHGVAVRARRDEPGLDGVRRRLDRAAEDPALGPRRHLRDGVGPARTRRPADCGARRRSPGSPCPAAAVEWEVWRSDTAQGRDSGRMASRS